MKTIPIKSVGSSQIWEDEMPTFSHGRINFNYNSDLSGDVIISTALRHNELHVPGEALLAFMANYVRQQRIGVLEDASNSEILGVRV